MEEERGFGNIIFYIILAIIAIVSSIKGKKKQQQGAPGGSRPSKADRSYFPDELFEGDEDEPAPERGRWEEAPPRETVIKAPGRTAAVSSIDMEGRNAEPMAAMFANEGVSALDHMETTRRFDELIRAASTHDSFDWDETEKATEEDVSGFNINLLTQEFDGRQAVILAEIINRKEY